MVNRRKILYISVAGEMALAGSRDAVGGKYRISQWMPVIRPKNSILTPD